jgi:hypothetical protein
MLSSAACGARGPTMPPGAELPWLWLSDWPSGVCRGSLSLALGGVCRGSLERAGDPRGCKDEIEWLPARAPASKRGMPTAWQVWPCRRAAPTPDDRLAFGKRQKLAARLVLACGLMVSRRRAQAALVIGAGVWVLTRG